MTITKTCNTCEHYPNDKHCIGCKWDKSKGENIKWELKTNPIVIERKVLDKIRAEIEQLPTNTRTNWDGCCPDFDYPEIEYVDVTKAKLLEIIDKYRGGSEE